MARRATSVTCPRQTQVRKKWIETSISQSPGAASNSNTVSPFLKDPPPPPPFPAPRQPAEPWLPPRHMGAGARGGSEENDSRDDYRGRRFDAPSQRDAGGRKIPIRMPLGRSGINGQDPMVNEAGAGSKSRGALPQPQRTSWMPNASSKAAGTTDSSVNRFMPSAKMRSSSSPPSVPSATAEPGAPSTPTRSFVPPRRVPSLSQNTNVGATPANGSEQENGNGADASQQARKTEGIRSFLPPRSIPPRETLAPSNKDLLFQSAQQEGKGNAEVGRRTVNSAPADVSTLLENGVDKADDDAGVVDARPQKVAFFQQGPRYCLSIIIRYLHARLTYGSLPQNSSMLRIL